MHRAKHQAGLTAIGLILILIPAGLAVYIILRAAPAYIEALSVGDVVNSLKKELDLKEKSREEISKLIQKRLYEINLPPDTFFLLNGGMELNRNRQPLV